MRTHVCVCMCVYVCVLSSVKQITNLCIRSPQNLEVPNNLNESHFSLHQCKPHSNTVSRSKTKWKVSTRMTFGLLL